MLSVNHGSAAQVTAGGGLFGGSSRIVERQSVQVVSVAPTRQLNIGTAVRNALLGGAAGGAVAGASYLGGIALPLIGSVTTTAGIARLAGAGAGIGLAAALLPVVAPSINRHPALKAALTGAGVGAAAGTFLPLLTPVGGAVVGAGVGLGAHLFSRRPRMLDVSIGRGSGGYAHHHGHCGHGMPAGPAVYVPGAGPLPAPPLAAYPPGFGVVRRPSLLQRLLGGLAGPQLQPAWTGAGYVGVPASPFAGAYGVAPSAGMMYGTLPFTPGPQGQGAGQAGAARGTQARRSKQRQPDADAAPRARKRGRARRAAGRSAAAQPARARQQQPARQVAAQPQALVPQAATLPQAAALAAGYPNAGLGSLAGHALQLGQHGMAGYGALPGLAGMAQPAAQLGVVPQVLGMTPVAGFAGMGGMVPGGMHGMAPMTGAMPMPMPTGMPVSGVGVVPGAAPTGAVPADVPQLTGLGSESPAGVVPAAAAGTVVAAPAGAPPLAAPDTPGLTAADMA